MRRKNKLYVGYWGGTLDEDCQVLDMTYFKEKLGYDYNDKGKIEELNVGEAVDLTQLGDVHIVMRVK